MMMSWAIHRTLTDLNDRRFPPDYKVAILSDYDRLMADGEKGALLRREAAHLSHRGVADRAGG